MEKIDFKFVAAKEGGQILEGYVPQQNGIAIGNSGVTVATGVDLGQMNQADIDSLDIASSLKVKLKPYALVTKSNAVALLKQKPLTLSRVEALGLDAAMQKRIFLPMIRTYNRESAVPFNRIPGQAQTVLASLAWHRGPGFYKFRAFRGIWNCAIYQNWEGMADELRGYETAVRGIRNRRRQEASLIDKIGTTAFT